LVALTSALIRHSPTSPFVWRHFSTLPIAAP
jgi:hypothetical protein